MKKIQNKADCSCINNADRKYTPNNGYCHTENIEEDMRDIDEEELLYENFLFMLKSQERKHCLITDYAKLLETTPHKLAVACDKYGGKHFEEILTDYIVNDLRYYIRRDVGLNEIAKKMHSSVNKLNKLITRHFGCTLVQFKKNVLSETKPIMGNDEIQTEDSHEE